MAGGAGSDKVLFLCLLSFPPAHLGHVSCRNPTKNNNNDKILCGNVSRFWLSSPALDQRSGSG